ncbi:P-loop containing nucleoside triphosphate hydrolase protein [Mycena floridula]|nr:P-loop containing nucleoside triphosphate hydrolase protein [Mycena floridula]
MAASGSQIHNIVKDNTFGNISGDVSFSNTIIIHHHYPAAPENPTRHVRGYMPVAKRKFFGRDQEIEKIVQILTGKPLSHIALLGAGGQGKTETALQAMTHPTIKEYYNKKNSIWVPCDEATSSELFLDVLFNSLALNQDNHDTLDAILKELCNTSNPIILLLDNFETPWNAPGARGAVARILQEIAQFSHVALFVTMRATIAPCEEIEWEEIKIQPLGPEASHQLFVSIYPQLQHDPELPDLLEMVGHMALAVKLMAIYGKNTRWSAKQLLSSYKSTGTSMLGSAQGSDAQNSVSPGCLLAQHLIILNDVIRSYLLDPLQPPDDIHDSMVNAACNFLQQYNSSNPGEKSFQTDMEVRSIEEINLQAILLQTSEFNTDVIEALRTLAWHQYRGRPRTEVIQHAVKLLQNITDQPYLVGNTLYCYAVILQSNHYLQESLQQYNLAQEAYIAASEPTFAAWTLIDIAEISVSIDSSFNEISLLEQAQHELESINEGGEQWRKAISRCLMLLGAAHSRRHNYSEALEHLIRARDLCSNSPFERVDCVYYLAQAHHRLQQLDEAEKTAVQTVNERKLIGAYLGGSLCLLGLVYISKNEYNKAIMSLEEGLQIAKAYGDQLKTADILLELGRAYMKMSKDNDAKGSFSQALLNYGNLEGVESNRIVCQYYLDKLDDASRLPTLEEEVALRVTWHHEDIPGYTSVIFPLHGAAITWLLNERSENQDAKKNKE